MTAGERAAGQEGRRLRADLPAVGLPSDVVEVGFTFDGQPLTALPGQSLGAALLVAGYRSWRTTRSGGRPRGLFCGIGVCFDCLITLNGRPNTRACLAPVMAGDVVSTQEGPGVHEV